MSVVKPLFYISYKSVFNQYFSVYILNFCIRERQAASIIEKSGVQLKEVSPVRTYGIINEWSLCCTNCCVIVPFVCDLSLTLDLAGIRYCRHGAD